jgi:hypothetical protein
MSITESKPVLYTSLIGSGDWEWTGGEASTGEFVRRGSFIQRTGLMSLRVLRGGSCELSIGRERAAVFNPKCPESVVAAAAIAAGLTAKGDE